MDKTVLKKFAMDARDKLMKDIKSKAARIGIKKEGITDHLPESTSDMYIFDIGAVETHKIYGKEVRQYEKLIGELNKRKADQNYNAVYDSLVEEIAYTWFNRLIAIRFMEVNNYLPDKMRILSSGREGVNEPEFVTHYLDTSLNFTENERNQLVEWKIDGRAPAMEKMFHLLFIKECNALNESLPELFEKTDDYAELLLNISYNDPDGVVYKLVHDVPEEYFDIESENGSGQVEIIGWMYQYYNTEPKAIVDAEVKKGKKVSKEEVPAKTQLFTPDWIVRYMVENSLGRLWIEKLIAGGDKRSEKEIAKKFNWEYYIAEAEQSSEVKEQLKEIQRDRKNIQLEDIKFIDPAMGSFHIGVYAFEIFMQLYESQGYTDKEAAKSIIENNLYGLDIDKRAYQLSYFAVMMKGRQYDRKILDGGIKCNLHTISESNNVNRKHLDYLGSNISDKKAWEKVRKEIEDMLDIFEDAKEYGSILNIPDKYDFSALKEFIINIKPQAQLSIETIYIEKTQQKILEIFNTAEILSQKYDIVVTNPPYMGNSNMNTKLSKYLKDNYPDSKSDLFATFMERCREFVKNHGYYAMITQHSWMFLSSYKKLRKKLQSNTICNMVHLGPKAFEEIGGEVVQSTAFVIKKISIDDYKGSYIRLVDFNNAEKKEIKTLEAIKNPQCGYYYETDQDNFKKIPEMPVAYWLSNNFIAVFDSKTVKDYSFKTLKGIYTGNNDKYLRYWQEVKYEDVIKKRWNKYSKGGFFRKWYGNSQFVIYWENNGEMLKNDSHAGVGASKYYGKPHIVWSGICSEKPSFREDPFDVYFDDVSPAVIYNSNKELLLGILNSCVVEKILKVIAPTIHFQAGDIKQVPIKEILYKDVASCIKGLVEENISIEEKDWDSFETSWDFKIHPLLDKNKQKQVLKTIKSAYGNWKNFANSQFDKLKTNEEELNRIFIKIYGLEDELTPEVSDRDITITKIFDTKGEIYDDIRGNRYILTKKDVIKSFISYAVGCMFGRYSLDIEGLTYAGGKWDDSKYIIFMPDKDNIILITDEEYFEDDIVNRFVEFVKACYGEETLEENLKFIADALGGKGTPREVMRNYFLKDFYKDHVKTYKKRPIYWMYDSGKENGFKALIYMHRYNEDTTGKLRVDYLHEMQKAYERTMDNLKDDIVHNKNPREVAKSEKRLAKITKQLKECKDYDEKIAHLALARIPIDLDDGVKVNYSKVQTDEKGKNLQILAKIR
ncbi:BREX-1 system adenine-specific DNA-methyltransferase PglX [Clostridium sp. HV4-5-A1G]|uniref:BREX-1 system adenine-specific DNA-methyltransferase PglX n=1 Tax=Clostridium sp. HV4-5-A1G TaxID=2004595 RepID=UPI00123B4F75|nr:BREX-1 system adenine-specific DNA-methyltransferase PglX [Clostridium sp. HV4-5-A1G]KAA8675104.1 BREX-1 system adenine-specific DNA-methyltransferase PglX [Clostridium sp. HV4-5-A1G]